ncbi:hypothetical protein DFH07DRAFT_962624 [Mycena maculata]|uniref:Uncharacterized protein n=2 Tax=Mycena maculata TaxID=230809 RepID=A0AAD7N5V4_9AGAR|nr:hypothetical protein DFH07DRAFT_962624 [Mycena maculata]
MLLSARVLKGQRLPEFSQFNSERHKALDSGAQDSRGPSRSTAVHERSSLVDRPHHCVPPIAALLFFLCARWCWDAPSRMGGTRAPPNTTSPTPSSGSGSPCATSPPRPALADRRFGRCAPPLQHPQPPRRPPPPKKKSTPRVSLVRERLVRDGHVCDAPAAARLRCRAPPLQHPALPTSPRAASPPPPALAGVPPPKSPTHEARPPRDRPPTSGSPCAASPPPPRPEASPALTSPTAYKIPARRRAAGNVSYLLTTTTTAPAAYKARLSARHLLLPHHHHHRGY